MANDTQMKPLTGKELVLKVKELDDLSKEEKAKACGYYTVTKDGGQRVNMMKFLNALIEEKEFSWIVAAIATDVVVVAPASALRCSRTVICSLVQPIQSRWG